jgi:hypothetical protein
MVNSQSRGFTPATTSPTSSQKPLPARTSFNFTTTLVSAHMALLSLLMQREEEHIQGGALMPTSKHGLPAPSMDSLTSFLSYDTITIHYIASTLTSIFFPSWTPYDNAQYSASITSPHPHIVM